MKDKKSTETLSEFEWIFVFERIAALARKKEAAAARAGQNSMVKLWDKLTNEVKPVPKAISILDLRYFIPFSRSFFVCTLHQNR
jgi:hypothetical protein